MANALGGLREFHEYTRKYPKLEGYMRGLGFDVEVEQPAEGSFMGPSYRLVRIKRPSA